MSQPNVILIICDQMRGDAIGADGNPCVHTPNLDYLASLGGRFNHAYSAVPSCIPARACLWSGQNQWHTGVLGMGRGQGPMPNNFPNTLASALTNTGYRTHLVGKGHFHPYRSPMGFESLELDESSRLPSSDFLRWFADQAPSGVITPNDHGISQNSWHARPWHTEERLHPTFWTMSRAIDFLQHRENDRPYFLNISFARPHSPYDPPQHYFDRYYPGGDLPEPNVGEWAKMHDDPVTALNPDAWRGRMTPDQIRRARAGYYGSISFIDTQIGRLMTWMRRNQQFKNTWLLFTSDHGDMQGDHNLWRKTYAYEGSTRIPFLLVPPETPDKPKRCVIDEVVGLSDVMPTLLEAAGIPPPNTMDGQSLLPLLQKPAENWRKYIHGEHCTCYSEEQEMQFLTNGKRKFIWLPRIGIEQFFNLEADPGECDNLVDEPACADEVAEWRNDLIAELEQRNCGWVKDGQLHYPEEALVSPFKNVRWPGPGG